MKASGSPHYIQALATEIGNLIATSRESVNKQLPAWQAAGLLEIDRGTLTLLQPAALNRLAGSSQAQFGTNQAGLPSRPEKNRGNCEIAHKPGR